MLGFLEKIQKELTNQEGEEKYIDHALDDWNYAVEIDSKTCVTEFESYFYMILYYNQQFVTALRISSNLCLRVSGFSCIIQIVSK